MILYNQTMDYPMSIDDCSRNGPEDIQTSHEAQLFDDDDDDEGCESGTGNFLDALDQPSASEARPSTSTSTERPSASTVQPSASMVQPSASMVRPSASTVRPSASMVRPSASMVRPSTGMNRLEKRVRNELVRL
jgi:hypothetical protein